MKNLYIGLLVLTLTIFLIPSLSAQQSKLRKAQHYMEALQYDKAIEIYDRLYRKNASSKEALNGLAKAYQKSGRLEDAKEWYAQAISQDGLPPTFYYYYGQILIQTGDCEGAQLQFAEFLRRKPYDARRLVLEDVCTYWKIISNKENVLVSLDHPDFNGTGSDLAPAFFNESLVFGSVRQSEGQKYSSYDLYSVDTKMDASGLNGQLEFGEVNSFSSTLNSTLNEAIITFSPDYTEAYFTRNKTEAIGEKHPLRRLEILVARQNGEGIWSAPEALPFNSPHYSTAHPALSADGNRLFFTSDKPGGFGGKDIYVCERDGLDWSTAVNLGPNVNTEGDELYPFFHSDGELYFSSDGQLGLGGQDVFKVVELGKGAWGEVRNLGFPTNTEADDFGFILSKNGSYGFLTSNRDGGMGGDDIYAFRPKRVLLQLNLVDSDGNAIENMIPLMEKEGLAPVLTDENGHLSLWMDIDECKYFTVVDDSYFALANEICASTLIEGETFEIDWVVQKKQSSSSTTDFVAKGEAILHGTVFDKLTGAVLSGAHIQLKSKNCEKSITLTSDKNGQFVYRWDSDCCFDVLVSNDGFFSKALSSICHAENGQPQEISVSLSPYRLNKMNEEAISNGDIEAGTELGALVYDDGYSSIPYRLNIYYDVGRASVRLEGLAELNRLKTIMKNNPTLLVEVCSHTDTRGSSAFNWRLSQRRANAIVNYLIKRGISSDRLIAKGYGEERLVNSCNDMTDCSEKEHQLNRRTEFRVLEHRYGQSN